MEDRNCQNCKQKFEIKENDKIFYQKMDVPFPTFCFECRRQRRFAWRNYINFYHRQDINGKDVISLYSPESKIPILDAKDWHKDNWDPFKYGMDYDFSKPFFEQYSELLKKVPKLAMDTDDGLLSKNCQYTNDFLMGKNCYLVVKAWKLEDVMYSFYVVDGRNLIDVCASFGKDENNYETVNTRHCYQCRFLMDSQSSIGCLYSYGLRNCDNCFLSSNLRGKQYCYKNEQHSKKEYKDIVKSYKLNTHSGSQKAYREFLELYKNTPKKNLRMMNCVNSLGDLLFDCKNCQNCFCVLKSENASYCTFADGVRDSLDADASGGSELVYESDLPVFCYKIIGSYLSPYCQNSYYLNTVYRSKNCFGCSGLKDAEYCILNKQYTKEEYEKLIPKIKKHMMDIPYVDQKGNKYVFGDFLPIELSYFGYNDTIANRLYPLTKSEITENHYPYQENKHKDEVKGAIPVDLIPDDIDDVQDDILKQVFISQKKQFRITKDELTFYRKHQIPIPRESFYERYERRLKYMSSFKLYTSKSSKSGKDIITSYNPNSNQIVWSEEEYKLEFE